MPASGPQSGEATDVLIRRWMMLFNLDRTQMATDDDQHLTEKKREHRPSRKQAIKFDEIEGSQAGGGAGSKAGAGGEQGLAIKAEPKDTYEIFRHGSHYLREAANPEVQRTELNRIELSMPKKLVDTVRGCCSQPHQHANRKRSRRPPSP